MDGLMLPRASSPCFAKATQSIMIIQVHGVWYFWLFVFRIFLHGWFEMSAKRYIINQRVTCSVIIMFLLCGCDCCVVFPTITPWLGMEAWTLRFSNHNCFFLFLPFWTNKIRMIFFLRDQFGVISKKWLITWIGFIACSWCKLSRREPYGDTIVLKHFLNVIIFIWMNTLANQIFSIC